MRRLLIIMAFIPFVCFANNITKTSIKAILSYPKIKSYRNNLKKRVKKVNYSKYILVGARIVSSKEIKSKIYRGNNLEVKVKLKFQGEMESECKIVYSF